MKLSISISEDQELRVFIKDLIKGQIKSVIADEFRALLSERLDKKIEAISSVSEIDKLLNDEIKKEISSRLRLTDYHKNFIKEHAAQLIKEKIDVAINQSNLFKS